MTGRAVVTTRLSRAAMKRAIELIANVQMTRVLPGIGYPCLLVVTKYSGEKRGASRRDRSDALLEHLEGPVLGLAGEPDGRAEVDQYPLGEEVVELSLRGARQLVHPPVQPAPLGADDVPDVRIGAPRVGLELHQQERPVSE